VVKVGLAFLDFGSAGLSTSGTYLVPYSEVVFLFDAVCLETGFAEGVEIRTCLGVCSVVAFSLSFVAGGAGEGTISSTCLAPCSAGFGVSGDF